MPKLMKLWHQLTCVPKRGPCCGMNDTRKLSTYSAPSRRPQRPVLSGSSCSAADVAHSTPRPVLEFCAWTNLSTFYDKKQATIRYVCVHIYINNSCDALILNHDRGRPSARVAGLRPRSRCECRMNLFSPDERVLIS